MATVKAPTLAASVNRFIVARAKLPGEPSRVDFRTASDPGFFRGVRAHPRSKLRGFVRLLEVLASLGCGGCVTGPSHHVASRAEPGARAQAPNDATAPGGLA